MRATKNYPTKKRRGDASDTRLGDLIFQVTQFRHWARFAAIEGRNGEAFTHSQKADHAIKALRTLGYAGEV